MLKFTSNWAEEIAEISTHPEFQTALVRLEDPDLRVPITEYDIDTGEQTFSGNPVVYHGQARIIAVRWGIDSTNLYQANPSTLSDMRVQFPRVDENGNSTFFGARKGFKLFIESAPKTPSLERLILTCTSDIQGSTSAARTFQFSVDGDSEVFDA